jgi:hypothetical protein
MTEITPAMRRALEAVKAGQCWRNYNDKSNTLHARNGVTSSATLWRLDKAGLIRDCKGTKTYQISYTQELTAAGEAALSGAA